MSNRRSKGLHELADEISKLIDEPESEIAHLMPGELVIPPALLTPEFLAVIQAEARRHGINPARLFVGSGQNSINPQTGQPEFFDPSPVRKANGPSLCQLPDGRIVPYTDLGLGYVRVEEGGVSTDAGAGVGIGHAVGGTNWPNESKEGGLAGGGKSGKVTSSLSRMLRDLTGSARAAPLRPITGTASVGGSLARAFPVIGSGMMFMDYLRTKDALENAPECRPFT